MNGRERILAMIEGRPTDSLPAMPITLTFASKRIGVSYRRAQMNRVNTTVEHKRSAGHGITVEGWIEGPAAESANLRALIEYAKTHWDGLHL